MKISLVLLVYNGGAKLRQAVHLLLHQNVPADLEYIAVDSGSTDGSVEFLKESGFLVFPFDQRHFAFGPVREYAFQQSSGDIIVTQSQDVIPRDDMYLHHLTRDIAAGRADVVQGLTQCAPDDDAAFVWERARSAFYFTREHHRFLRQHGGIGLSCECLAISRRAWSATGFGGSSYCEDKAMQKRLTAEGFRITRTPGPIAWHGHAYDLRGLIKRCLNEGVGWREAGVRYSLGMCLYDLTVGFGRRLHLLLNSVWSGRARSPAAVLFFQIRPISLLVGNRFCKKAIL